MYIDSAFILKGSFTNYRRYQYGDDAIAFVSGLLFDLDEQPEKEIVEKIAFQIVENKTVDFKSLLGNHIVFLIFPNKNSAYVFGDNSGMRRPYYALDKFGTNFIELVESTPTQQRFIDLKEVCSFLQFGWSYDGGTLMKSIARLARDKYLCIENGNGVSVKSKEIEALNSKEEYDSKYSLDSIFLALASTIKKKKVSLDLTGGRDSRLIAVIANKYLKNIEAACSCKSEDMDIRLGRMVADALKMDYFPTKCDGSELSLESIKKILIKSDFNVDPFWFHRVKALIDDRLDRGVELQLMGGGGELYRDAYWTQDFPFFRSRKSKTKKFFHYRMLGSKISTQLFSPEMKLIFDEFIISAENKLSTFICSTNTETYDNIYYNVNEQGHASQALLARSNWIDAYNPLLEPELVKMSYLLPRRARLLGLWHRKEISRYSSSAANIPLDSGGSCSYETVTLLKEVIPNIFRLVSVRSKQYLKVLLNSTSYYAGNRIKLEFADRLRNTPECAQLVKKLISLGILNSEVSLDEIPDQLLGRVMVVALLVEMYEFKSQEFAREPTKK